MPTDPTPAPPPAKPERPSRPPMLYSMEDACDAAAMSRSTAYRLLQAGKLEGRKRGRKVLIVGESLRAYVASLPPVELPGRT